MFNPPPDFDPPPVPLELFAPPPLFAFDEPPELKLPAALLPPDFPEDFAAPPEDALAPPVLLPVVAVLVVPRPEPVVDFDVPPAADLEEAPPPPPVPDLLVDLPPELLFAELPPEVFFPAVDVPPEDLAPDFDAPPLFAEPPPLLAPAEALLPELFAEEPEPPFAPDVFEEVPFAPVAFEPAEDPVPDFVDDPVAPFPEVLDPPDFEPPADEPDLVPPDLRPPAAALPSPPIAISAAVEAAPTTAPWAAPPTNSATTFFAWSNTLSSVPPAFDLRELDPAPLVCFGISIPLFCFSTRIKRPIARMQEACLC